jgi:hypothetical protein
MADRKAGARHGTYSGTPTFGISGLPGNSNGAVNFGGVGTSSVPHDAGLALGAFSLMVWFRLNAFPPVDSSHAIVCKGASGLHLGDLDISVTDDGTFGFQFQTASAVYPITTSQPIETGITHCLIVRADNTGFDGYFDARFLTKRTEHSGAWSSNTQPMTFATAPWAQSTADVVIDEVAIWGRVITEAEIITLSKATGILPVAENGSATAPESATTTIDLPPDCSFVGSKAGLTVTVVSQPAGGDSVSVDGSNNFRYVAGAVTATTTRSFSYRIANTNGQSNTATITVTVLDVAAVASNAVCYVLTGSTTVVSSLAGLQTAITNAAPGNRIQVQAGTYSSGTVAINNNGTLANPIVIEPQGAIGSVTFTAVAFDWNAASSYIVFRGFNHNGGRHHIRGVHNRIDLCQFRQIAEAIWVRGALDSRISRCDFSDFGVLEKSRCIYFEPSFFASGATFNFLVDYNYIHDITPAAVGTGNQVHEMIGSFGNVSWFYLSRPTVIVDHNRFENISVPNESELITCKWGGGIWRFNTIINSDERVVLRRSGNWEIRSNWFDATSIPLEIYGPDHLVIGNRFGTGTVRVEMGYYYWPDHGGDEGLYVATDALQFCNNTGGTIRWGHQNNVAATVPVRNSNHFGNTGTMTFLSGGHIGTTNTNPGLAFTPAVELTAAEVGRSAASDPLCP